MDSINYPDSRGVLIALIICCYFVACRSYVEPKITYVSPSQKVIVSNTATFHCIATGAARNSPKIEWHRVRPPIQIFPYYRCNITHSNTCLLNEIDDHCVLWSTLTLSPTDFSDSGCYKCLVKDNLYRFGLGKMINLTVLMAPNIIEVPDNQFTNSTKSVTFQCAATANPNPVITWMKDGIELENTTKRLIHVYNNSGNCIIDDKCDVPLKSDCKSSTILQLFNVQLDDNGEYSCHFTNGIGNKSERAILSVDGTPVIVDAPKNQTIVTSTDTLFTCTATGYPCPNIHWIHNNSNVSNKSIGAVKYKNFIHVAKLKNDLSPLCTIKSTIVIANVTANDYGDYTCKASNIVGNAVAPAQLGTESNESDYNVAMFVGIIGGIFVLIISILVISIISNYMQRRKIKALDLRLNGPGPAAAQPQGRPPAGNPQAGNRPAGGRPAVLRQLLNGLRQLLNRQAAAQPQGGQPQGGQPQGGLPQGGQPQGGQPQGGQPQGRQPQDGQPQGGQPQGGQPQVGQPQVGQPQGGQPQGGQPQGGQPQGGQPQGGQPQGGQPQDGQPQGGQPQGGQPQGGQPAVNPPAVNQLAGGQPAGNNGDINHRSLLYQGGPGQRPVQQRPAFSLNNDCDGYVTADEDEDDERTKLVQGKDRNHGTFPGEKKHNK